MKPTPWTLILLFAATLSLQSNAGAQEESDHLEELDQLEQLDQPEEHDHPASPEKPVSLGTLEDQEVLEKRYFFSVLFGGAHNFPTPLDIHIDDREDIHFDSANYAVNPFSGSPYYVLRTGKMDSNWTGWELEVIHHKLYLENKHDDIQHFTITDGYNGFNINHLAPWKGLNIRYGGGIVISHPETTIYERIHPEDRGFSGYHLSGIGMRLSAGKYFSLTDNLFIETDAGFWATYSVIPVMKGSATIPHFSFHANIGLGYFF